MSGELLEVVTHGLFVRSSVSVHESPCMSVKVGLCPLTRT